MLREVQAHRIMVNHLQNAMNQIDRNSVMSKLLTKPGLKSSGKSMSAALIFSCTIFTNHFLQSSSDFTAWQRIIFSKIRFFVWTKTWVFFTFQCNGIDTNLHFRFADIFVWKNLGLLFYCLITQFLPKAFRWNLFFKLSYQCYSKIFLVVATLEKFWILLCGKIS